jgi:solute carrier family 25 glutamate transporter 18/22
MFFNHIQIRKICYLGSAVNILLITPEKAIKLVANDVFRQLLKTK